MNELFETFLKEEEPVFDISVITEKGEEYWRNPHANNANNSHSVTKFFVASAIGTLCDAGRLSPDTKIASLFTDRQKGKNYRSGWDAVTVRDALRHKTGMDTIPYNVDDDEQTGAIGDDFLAYVFSLPIEHTPGTFRRYSDEAYYLLGRVIHAVTGQTADEYMKNVFFDPLGYRQWAMAKCPMGHPICGGGFFARSDDVARLGFVYACGGTYQGRRILSEQWITDAMENDYACTRFRDTDVFLKTGSRGQIVAFSRQRKSAAAWHGISLDQGKRNDRLLEGYCRFLDETFGTLG